MAAGSLLWTILGGLITFAIFSFLYKDNAAYKMAEHIAVGLSVGFLVVNYYDTVFIPKVWNTILHERQFDYLLPLVLGLLLFTRFIPKYGWLSRTSMAFYIGAGSGMGIPPTLEAQVLQQMRGSVGPLYTPVSGHPWAALLGSLSAVFLFLGTLACLTFFFFSVEHKGGIGRFAYFGRLCIMAGFGASFGYTVMGRVSLLIGRVHFLTRDFVHALGGLFS